MKKTAICIALLFLTYSETKACAWYDPDYDYFNLFTQTIIQDKSYVPFLHTLSNRFYGHEHFEIPDENILSWQKYFSNILSYTETKALVEKIPLGELRAYRNGKTADAVLNKLGSYQKFCEGLDYLMEAKYLEPYMRINYVETADSFYYRENENEKNATQLDYEKTVQALTSLYTAAKNPEIKLRYGYQLVRFNHYTRHYHEAAEDFKKYVQPLKLRTAPYYMALDQLAGAQRGLSLNGEANWNFFQVFSNSKNRKESAFVSMKLSDSASFNNILRRAQTPEEKNMAYFLLAYDDFTNPVPLMEKMYDINPASEILKVLAARSVNELERNYLPEYVGTAPYGQPPATKTAAGNKTIGTPTAETSVWQKIVNFFTRLFTSASSDPETHVNKPGKKALVKNPNRLPFYNDKTRDAEGSQPKNFLGDFEALTAKIKDKSDDAFWQITFAYLNFLKKDYEKSADILGKIKTDNPEYLSEIQRMTMLNDIVSQPIIDAETEDKLVQKYPKFFDEMFAEDPTPRYEMESPSTQDFIRDILANRYFLQGDLGKSFLLSNTLSDLQYNPNVKLTQAVEQFTEKQKKTALEQKILQKGTDQVGNVKAFFNVIYGDHEVRQANFQKAAGFYKNAQGFSGIPRTDYAWKDDGTEVSAEKNYGENYNGFSNIPDLVFGHNVWESFQSPANVSMERPDFSDFPFIKKTMNKLELVQSLLQLETLANGDTAKAAQANQLIGNLLYNTSSLGYFRELFVMDIDNANGPKFQFYNTQQPAFQYYYKNFAQTSFVQPDNFDLALGYYDRALKTTADPEVKARILFQMASAEQGKYYQYEANHTISIDYSNPNYDKEIAAYDQKMSRLKNEKYRTYFTALKRNYANTSVSKQLQSSCTYYDYFLKKQ